MTTPRRLLSPEDVHRAQSQARALETQVWHRNRRPHPLDAKNHGAKPAPMHRDLGPKRPARRIGNVHPWERRNG